MRVNIEASAFLDPRFEALAMLSGWSGAYEAIGRMARLWLYCTTRETDVLAPFEVAGTLGLEPDRAAEVLVDCNLGELTEDGIRVKGCQGRTDWLARKREQGRIHGRKGGRPKKGDPSASKRVTLFSEKGCALKKITPPAPAPAPDRSRTNAFTAGRGERPPGDETGDQTAATGEPVPAPEEAPAPEPSKPRARSKPRAKPAPEASSNGSGDYQRVIAAWHELYLAAYGTKPTWGPTEGAICKRLLSKHSLAELEKRMRYAFMHPPPWLETALDLKAFERHLDKFVPLSRPTPKRKTF